MIAFSVTTPGGSFGDAASPSLDTSTFIAESWIVNLQAAADALDAVIAVSFDGTNIAAQLNLAHVKTMTLPFRAKKVWLKKVSGASTCLVAVTAVGYLGGGA